MKERCGKNYSIHKAARVEKERNFGFFTVLRYKRLSQNDQRSFHYRYLCNLPYFLGQLKSLSGNVYQNKIPSGLDFVNFSLTVLQINVKFLGFHHVRREISFGGKQLRFLTWCFPTVTLVECCIPRASRYRWVVGAAVIVRSGCDTHCLECYTEI